MKSRRYFALILIAALFVSIVQPAKAASSGWAVQEIEKAKKYGLIDEAAQINYQDYITREEFCELMVRLFTALTGKDIDSPNNSPFIDTDNPFIIKAYTLEIIKGVNDGIFDPKGYITREQLAAMINRLISAINPAVVEGQYLLMFKDAGKISSWAKKAVACITSKGIMRGVGQNTSMPGAAVTWEQAIALAVRVYDLLKSFLLPEKLSSGDYIFRIYKSSNFPEDYLEMRITNSDVIEVSGKILLNKRYLWFQIESEDGEKIIDDFRMIKENGIFSFRYSHKESS